MHRGLPQAFVTDNRWCQHDSRGQTDGHVNDDSEDKASCFKPGPKVIKLFSCSTQLSMKFSPLINVKMPTTVGILTCMSGKNNILGLTEP